MSNGPTAAPAGEEPGLDRTERLKIDYGQTTELLRSLTDVRFKLLALVPTFSGAAIALLGHPASSVQLLTVGVLGLTATVGILLYELRNSQIYDYAFHRAQEIEHALGLVSFGPTAHGGLFSEEPDQAFRVLGISTVSRDRGFALVYSAALGGWSYLAAWGALRAMNVGNAQPIGAVIAVAVGVIVLAQLARIRERPDRSPSSASTAKSSAAPTSR